MNANMKEIIKHIGKKINGEREFKGREIEMRRPIIRLFGVQEGCILEKGEETLCEEIMF